MGPKNEDYSVNICAEYNLLFDGIPNKTDEPEPKELYIGHSVTKKTKLEDISEFHRKDDRSYANCPYGDLS